MPGGITRTTRQPLLGGNLPVADIDAPRLVIDLVNDRELIAFLNELDRVCARQAHHRGSAVVGAERGTVEPRGPGKHAVLLDATLSFFGQRQRCPRTTEARGAPLPLALRGAVGLIDAREIGSLCFGNRDSRGADSGGYRGNERTAGTRSF